MILRIRAVLVSATRRVQRLCRRTPPCSLTQARKLIRAIDAGGIPLDPVKVNAIARNLGLEVSRRAPVEHTVERIRTWLRRA